NLDQIDSACGDLDYIVSDMRSVETQIMMSNNFAFGGINTSLIFKRV
ncbi:MAG: beta-ketoacyl-ACP synthase, partial [Acinetobacter sp.]